MTEQPSSNSLENTDPHSSIEKATRKAANALLAISEDKFTFEIRPYSTRGIFLDLVGVDKEAISILKSYLEKEGLELGSIASSGNDRATYVIFEQIKDGKVNWRRWANYPDSISAKSQQLLDHIADFTEINDLVNKCGGDKYSRFENFFLIAYEKGLINKEEFRSLKNETNAAANGGYR